MQDKDIDWTSNYGSLTDQEKLELIEKNLDQAIETATSPKDLGKRSVEIFNKLAHLKNALDTGTSDGTVDYELFLKVASKLYSEAFGIKDA